MRGFDAIHELLLHTSYGPSYKMELIEPEDLVGTLLSVSNPESPSVNNPTFLFPTIQLSQLLTYAEPDILIGINDYSRLQVSSPKILPSGFHKFQSQLGSLFAGQEEGEPEEVAQLAAQIGTNIYVDNVLVGFSDATEFKPLYDKIEGMFHHCHMNMREFMTNANRQMILIPQEDQLPQMDY
jgi:hypothetical protein